MMHTTEHRKRPTRWVQRSRYAVEVETEVFCPVDDRSEPCIDTDTARFLDRIAHPAQRGDLAYPRTVGHVYEAIATA